MKLFTCDDHATVWPVGAASVVIAPDEETARQLLKDELRKHHLATSQPFTLKEISLDEARAVIICDGDY